MKEVRYISEKQVSIITGIALSTLRNSRFKGIGLPYYKLGRCVRYRYGDVIKYVEDRKVKTSKT